MNCDSIQETIPSFVIGALDDHEARAVREHVCRCESCADDLASYELVPDALNIAVDEAPLPAGFTTRLVERATPVRALPSVSPRRRWIPARLPWAVVAASLILSLTLGGRAWQLDRQLAAVQAGDGRAADLMADPKVVDLALDPSPNAAYGRIYVSPEWDACVLIVSNLPALKDGQVYQVWLNGSRHRVSGGTFRPVAEGSTLMYVKPPAGLDGYNSVGVTIEPAGGSPAPTTRRVIGGELD